MLKLSFRKRLGNFQLEIDHTIMEKVTAFLGPSGSGKSTLLNCISGILNPDDGELLFSDQTLYSSQQKRCLPPEKAPFRVCLSRRISFSAPDGSTKHFLRSSSPTRWWDAD